MAVRIGIDTGGTFTDVVRWSHSGLQVTKVPSTPRDPGAAVLHGLAAARRHPAESVDVVHGSTVGLNAVLTGAVARTAFVTNAGFEDLIEIGRQERSDLYALEPDRPQLPVPRTLRVGVECRRGPGGAIVQRLSAAAIERTVRRLRRLRPTAVAIGLLHSPADPADERRLAAAIGRALPGVAVTGSAELWPTLGEFERFSAAILNAAVQPLVGTYTRGLQQRLGSGHLRLMRSSMGIMPATEAAAFPARAMFSGPAGGVLATRLAARACGFATAAAFDMGGTSTDVCLVRGDDLLTDQGRIAGLPLPLPAVDVHTVGCGGGSIAYADHGGVLRVGPQSAGADPGPACYGAGSDPTVTDAHMALGHLGAETLLGGAFRVDPDASVRAIERLARRLGVPPRRAALGILQVAEANMARALMVITVERAVDPETVPLVAYGGAGGLHGASLAARLGMPSALVPHHPGAFSAVGLALAGESAEAARALLLELTADGEKALARHGQELAAEARAGIRGSGNARVSLTAVVRFRGQGQGIRVPLGRGGLLQRFRRAHALRFGFVPEDVAAEAVLVLARAETRGKNYPLSRPAQCREARTRAHARPHIVRRPPLGGSPIRVFLRPQLTLGSTVAGPAAVEEMTGTTLMPPGSRALVTRAGLLLDPPDPGGKV